MLDTPPWLHSFNEVASGKLGAVQSALRRSSTMKSVGYKDIPNPENTNLLAIARLTKAAEGLPW